MAKVQFKTYTPNEIVLFPSNLGERIPKDHPVRLLSRIVDGLDLTELIRTYKGGKTKCGGSRDEGVRGKELDNRELGAIEGNEGRHNQM